MTLPSPRAFFFSGFLFSSGLLLTALYYQFVEGLEPCPLCISQRIMVLLTALVLLAASVHAKGRRRVRVFAVLGAVMALSGASLSARHVWLQHLPAEEVPACGPGLAYVFENFPMSETLRMMLTGTGDCATVDWTLLGLSMPGWLLVCFLLLAALSLGQWWNSTQMTP